MAGVVQPGASGAFLARVGREEEGGQWGRPQCVGGWGSVEVTGRISELRENAEYQVWYVKKPCFYQKNFKGSFKLFQEYS